MFIPKSLSFSTFTIASIKGNELIPYHEHPSNIPDFKNLYSRPADFLLLCIFISILLLAAVTEEVHIYMEMKIYSETHFEYILG